MSVSVIFLPILILAALALGVLVYYICYKAAINRKLRAEESGAHVPMASMESVWKVVAVIAVFVMFSSLSSKITNLQNDVMNLRSALGDKTGQLQYELDEMQRTMKKEASMISEVFYDFGEINTEEHTVEMRFWVVQKSYSEETEMSLNYRGQTITLTNNGAGTFTGSTVLPMFEENYEDGLFCVTEGGETKTEMWEDLPKECLQYYCLPQFYIEGSSVGYRKKKDSVRVNVDIRVKSKKDGVEQFRDLTLYVKKGDTVIDEIPLDNGYISLDRSYTVKDGDSIDLFVKGIDKYGYMHEEFFTGWNTDEMSADVGYEQTVYPYQVYKPDGTAMME